MIAEERVEVVVLSPEEREQYNMFIPRAKEKHIRRGRDASAQVRLLAILKLRQLLQSWHAKSETGGLGLQRYLPLSSVWQFITFVSPKYRSHSKCSRRPAAPMLRLVGISTPP